MIGFFDFDMTTANTVGKESPSLSQFRNASFAVQDILSAKPTSITHRMKKYRKVFILTARSSGNGEMRNAMQKYFMRNGIYIPRNRIIMLGDWNTSLATAEKKRYTLKQYTRFLGNVDFFDDDSKNIEFSSSLEMVRSFQV